jgi:hypothetical protein
MQNSSIMYLVVCVLVQPMVWCGSLVPGGVYAGTSNGVVWFIGVVYLLTTL